MRKFTAAVVGTGFIGPVHVEGLRRAGVNVRGILGSSFEKSKTAAKELQLEVAYRDLDEILGDASVDVVHLTSPNRCHFEQASRVIKSGKHVVCEKPLAMNSTESAELVRLASESGVIAAVNYNLRFYPLSLESHERVRSGDSGKIFHVTGSYAQDWLFHPTDYNWRVDPEQGGALRAVADIGTHWLDLIQYIVGKKVDAVFADLCTVHPVRQTIAGSSETFSQNPTPNSRQSNQQALQNIPVTTEDFGSVLLRFQGGAKGVMWVSQVDAGRKNCLQYEIAGEKYSLHWNSESPNQLHLGHRDDPNQSLIRDPALMSLYANQAASYPGGHNEGFGDSFKQLFRAVYAAIEKHRDGISSEPNTYPTFADGHREIVLCEAILKSHQAERWVNIEE